MNDSLTAAPATPLVLSALAEGESYGYAILKRVRELSGGQVDWPDGMLYPLLHRLRRLGYVTADWKTVSEGHRRRYYQLTPIGRRPGIAQRGPARDSDAASRPERMHSSFVPALRVTRCQLALATANISGGHR